MKVVLIFPPHWTPTMPHLALPALTSYLRSHGVEVVQRDLNLETFDQVLTRTYLRPGAAGLSGRWRTACSSLPRSKKR